jgi:hypothetical protein
MPRAVSCPGKGLSTYPSLKKAALSSDRPRLFKYSTAVGLLVRSPSYRAVASSKKLFSAGSGTREIAASFLVGDYVEAVARDIASEAPKAVLFGAHGSRCIPVFVKRALHLSEARPFRNVSSSVVL